MFKIFIGFLFVFFHFRINGFDVLLNPVGYALVFMGLCEFSGIKNFNRAKPLAITMVLVSCAEIFIGVSGLGIAVNIVSGMISVLILLALICIGGGIYLYIKYFKRTPQQEEDKVVKIPPHEKALDELNKLKEDKLWQAGQSKLYFTRLTDILREYLDSRFAINAMEMTSTEILKSLRANKETKLVEKNMKQILEVADFVKFAKMSPLPEDNESAMRNAINFVELTIPHPEEVEEPDVKE